MRGRLFGPQRANVLQGRLRIFFVPEIPAESPDDKLFNAVSQMTRKSRTNFKGIMKHLSLATNIIARDDGQAPQVRRFDLYSVYC